MRLGITISTILHAAVLLLGVYGLPWFMNTRIPEQQVMLVELVTVADETTPQVKPEPEPESKPEPDKPAEVVEKPPEKKPAPEPPPPEPEVAEAPPPPPPEPVAEEKAPEPEPVPEPEPKPTPQKVVQAPTPLQKPKPPAKVKPKKAAEPPKKPKPERPKFDANRIAALLSKEPREASQQPTDDAAKRKPAPQRTSRAQPTRLTMSEIDAIRVQIQQCWSIPSGARYAENLRVQIRIFLNPDGSLARAPEIVGNTGQQDEFWRTAAESARRAVLRCSPLKSLPVEKYERWREITLTFDPKEMLGG